MSHRSWKWHIIVAYFLLLKFTWRVVSTRYYQCRWKWLPVFNYGSNELPKTRIHFEKNAWEQHRQGGDDVLQSWLSDKQHILNGREYLEAKKAAFRTYSKANHPGYLSLAEELRSNLADTRSDNELAIKIALLDYNRGDFSKAKSVLSEYSKYRLPNRILGLLDELVDLADEGYHTQFEPKKNPIIERKTRRIVYISNYSLPHVTNGYTTRTHGLVSGLIRSGLDIEVLNRYGFPGDIKWRPFYSKPFVIDGVQYHIESSVFSGFRLLPYHRYIDRYATYLYHKFSKNRPAAIQVASNFINAIAATTVGKTLGIPVVYEVRGLWEITRLSRQSEWLDSDEFRLMQKLETQAAKNADRVLTLTKALADELIRRGVENDKIILLPNAVDCNRFSPRVLENRQSKTNKEVCTFGYIGSLVDYEGLDLLLEAVKKVIDSGEYRFRVVIVGKGDEHSKLTTLLSLLEITSYVELRPPVSYKDVPSVYGEIDVAVFPRKPLPVCEIVSPLKPFEALAMNCPILVSSVGALQEIVTSSGMGTVFEKGNVDDLTEKMRSTIHRYFSQHKDEFYGGRSWVCTNHSWDTLAHKNRSVLDGLT